MGTTDLHAPYFERKEGQLIRSSEWNELQRKARQEIHCHTHTGGESGTPIPREGIKPNAIDGTRIDPSSTVTLAGLKLGGLDLKPAIESLNARATALESTRVKNTGDTISGELVITGALTVGPGELGPIRTRDIDGRSRVTDDAARGGVGPVQPAGQLTVTGTALIDGNVGIGVLQPACRLHVATTEEAALRLESTHNRTIMHWCRKGQKLWEMGAGTDANNGHLWWGDGTGCRMVLDQGTGDLTITGSMKAQGGLQVKGRDPLAELDALTVRATALESSRVNKAGDTISGNLVLNGNLTVGAGGSARIRTVHVEGKHPEKETPDRLYLNYSAGVPVVIGSSETHSGLELYGGLSIVSSPAKDTTEALSRIHLTTRGAGGQPVEWALFAAAVAGGWGVNPNAFEIWEYVFSVEASRSVGASRFQIRPKGNTLLCPSGGNVGIRMLEPGEHLSIGGMGACIELGAGLKDKEANGGKIAYRKFSDALDIVGGGSNGERRLKIWAEQGSEFTGPIAMSGGAIIPRVGNSASAGIQFPSDPGGGSGDEAFIRYYVEEAGTEKTKLLIGINDNPNDTLGLWQMGAERLTLRNGYVHISTHLGIGVPEPGEHLSIGGMGACIELGAGVEGKASDGGKIAYCKSSDALEIFGGGSNGERRLKIWAWEGTQFEGPIIPQVGNSAHSGIQFPKDPGGGSGDEAFIRYYVEEAGTEKTKLVIGIENDPNDTLGLWQMGAERLTLREGFVHIHTSLGIRVPAPGEHLSIGGMGACIELGAGLKDKEANGGKIAYRKWSDALDIVGGGPDQQRWVKIWAEQGTEFTGPIIPRVGNSETAGIQFPSDPGGGSGDEAFIRYVPASVDGGRILRIGATHALELWQGSEALVTLTNRWVNVLGGLNIRGEFTAKDLTLQGKLITTDLSANGVANLHEISTGDLKAVALTVSPTGISFCDIGQSGLGGDAHAFIRTGVYQGGAKSLRIGINSGINSVADSIDLIMGTETRMSIYRGNTRFSGNVSTNGLDPTVGVAGGIAGNGLHTYNVYAKGAGRAVSGWQTGGWDLAEKFDKHDPTLEPGDVVVADPSTPERLIRSSAPYERTLLGVISEKPGFLLGVAWEDPLNPIALGLAGRLRVKVTLEGGPIRIGEPLTSSSVPGHAMRATRSGRVLGIALEDFDGSQGQTGKIVMLLNPHWMEAR